MAEGDEGSADCRLVARLCGVLEAVADGAPLAETSAACRAAIADHVVELERAEAAGEAAAAAAADALDGVLAVWHLCEACCLDAPPVRACRLAAWLRAHAFDGAAERDEFDALAPLLARLDAPAEAWAPDDTSDDDEARRPLWQLAFRECLRGRGARAWAALRAHSTRRSARLAPLWAPVGALLEALPAAPDVEPGGARGADGARAAAARAHARAVAAWRADARRARAALVAGAAPLVSAAPPLRALAALLAEGDVDGAARVFGDPGPEGRLLAEVVYAVDASGGASLRDACARAARAAGAAAARDAATTARLRLLGRLAVDGDAAAAVAAVAAVAGDAAAPLGCAAALAALCDRGAGGAPLPPPGAPPLPRLAPPLLERAAAAVEGASWRLAARVLLLGAGGARDAYAALLTRAAPRDDADAWDLARLCAAEGLARRARAVCDGRGDAALADGADGAAAAAWYVRAELLDDPALARGRAAVPRDRPSERPFACDGRLEEFCGAAHAALAAALARASRADAGADAGALARAAARASAAAAALDPAHDADARERAGLGHLVVAGRLGPRAEALATLAPLAAALAGPRADDEGALLARAVAAAAPRDAAVVLACAAAVLDRAAAGAPDPLRYADAPPARPPVLASPDVLALMEILENCAAPPSPAAAARLRLRLAEALAAAFVHENRRDQRDAGAAAVGRHPDPAPAFSLSAAELLASPELI